MARRLTIVALLVGAVVASYLLQDRMSLEWIVNSERWLREQIDARPARAFAIGFFLYIIVSIVPGTSGKSVIAGWFFGFWPAFLMVVGALTFAGMISFSIARHLFRDSLRDFFGLRLSRFDRLVEREGVFYLLTLRLLHVPFSFVNYLSGVSAIRPLTFAWTTVVGLIPGTVVLVGLGAGLPSLNELIEQGVISLLSPAVAVSLLAMGLMPLIVRWFMRHRGEAGLATGPVGHNSAVSRRPR